MSENQSPNKEKLPLFHLSERYPDVNCLLNISLPKIETFIDDAIFVLDTNVLLLPYKTSKESLDKIKSVYAKLISENRLFIPEQAVREFINKKFDLIEGMYSSLSSAKENTKDLQLKGYPLIKSLGKYQDLCDLQSKINTQLKEYRETVDSILKDISSWQLNDPVSHMYKELFTNDVVVNCGLSNSQLEVDFNRRSLNKIPPGYKDSSKPDSGIGDVIIWLTILELGRKHQKPLIFITAEKKEDWWELFNKNPISPRLELIDEYSRNSNQNAFSILELSELLETFKVKKELVEEVKNEETIFRFRHSEPGVITLHKIYIGIKFLLTNQRAKYNSEQILGYLNHFFPESKIRVTARSDGFFVEIRFNFFESKEFIRITLSSLQKKTEYITNQITLEDLNGFVEEIEFW